MRLSRSRIVVLAICGFLSWGGSAQAQLEFLAVEKGVIEQRFQRNKFGNGKRAKELAALFEEAGCPNENLSLQKVKRSANPNVACTLPGTTDALIVVGAHFDAVATSSGAVDNWSGAALLPSLYDSLSHPQRKHTFVFIGFTDEEKGLFGSRFYVDQLTEEQKPKVRAMINLDTLGLSPTKVWVNTANPGLVNTLGIVAEAMKLPVSGTDFDKIGTTDSASFSKAGIPAMTIHSLTQETVGFIHTPADKPERLNLDWYYDTFRLTAAYLAYLDQGLE